MAPNDKAGSGKGIGGDRDKSLETALAQIERQFGRGAIMRLGDDTRAPIEVIPTGSISLDVALGIGGLPRGRIVEIYGPESSGKTSLALHAIANAQKAGGIAAIIDAEHALDPDYAKNLGVDTDALLVSQPDTGEQALEIADMLIRSSAIDIIVIDSVAALVPRAEIEGEMGDSHVGLQARLMSQALRKIAGALNQTKTTAIFINQLREKIGVMFGSPETTTGGKALKFYASIRLDIRRIETLKDGTDAVGNRTRVKVVKNKCLAEGTRIFDPVTGHTHRIEDIVDQQLPVHVVAADKNGALHVRPVTSWLDQGEQEVIGLKLRDGTTLWVTPDHKIMTEQGWHEAQSVCRAETGLPGPGRLRASDHNRRCPLIRRGFWVISSVMATLAARRPFISLIPSSSCTTMWLGSPGLWDVRPSQRAKSRSQSRTDRARRTAYSNFAVGQASTVISLRRRSSRQRSSPQRSLLRSLAT